MPTQIIMPQLGESVHEATIGKWLKNEGDPVKEFEPILEITTDKVDTEITAAADGVLLQIAVPDGVTAQVGAVLGYIGQPGESPTGDNGNNQLPVTNNQSPILQPSAPRDLGFISPVVAKLAAEHKVDLQMIQGTGLGNRITKKDVLAFVESGGSGLQPRQPEPLAAPAVSAPPSIPMVAASTPSTPTPPHSQTPSSHDTLLPLSTMRRAIAEHMVRSKHTSPHVTTVFEVDMSKVIAHREANKAVFARDGVNLTFTAYFVSAIAVALKAFPVVNSVFADDKLILKREVNIGVAVSLGDEGLIVPVIKQADEKSLLGLARAVNDLANRARAKQLKPDEVQGGTFTLTNHGVSGSLFATPIISQPQCAILGVGAIQKRVVVIGDAIAIRPMCYIGLTFDHRIIDGAIADYFMAKVKETLEGWGA